MRFGKVLAVFTLSTGLIGFTAFADQHDKHQTAEKHEHMHKEGCGHKAEKHGDHTDYEDNGHHHKAHADHFDECDGPEAAAQATKKK